MIFTHEMKLSDDERMHYLARLYDSLRVNPETGCFEWTGHLRAGYGLMRFQKRQTGTHRVMMGCIYGEVPMCLETDHLCRNKRCFHPDHLELVTHQENLLRSPTALGQAFKNRTHCKNGHAFNKENTRLLSNGARRCRTCNDEKVREWCQDNRARMNEISRESYERNRDVINQRRRERALLKRWGLEEKAA